MLILDTVRTVAIVFPLNNVQLSSPYTDRPASPQPLPPRCTPFLKPNTSGLLSLLSVCVCACVVRRLECHLIFDWLLWEILQKYFCINSLHEAAASAAVAEAWAVAVIVVAWLKHSASISARCVNIVYVFIKTWAPTRRKHFICHLWRTV